MLKQFHVYNPVDNDYLIVIAWVYHEKTYEHICEMRTWCYKMYGESAPDAIQLTLDSGYKWKDFINFGEIEFINENDANWFLLKWQT